MVTRTPNGGRETSARSALCAAPAIEGLVRGLVTRLQNGNRSPVADPSPNGSAPQVLLDVDVDGQRYLLLRSPARNSDPKDPLSPREAEIARLVALGHPNKSIAAILEISPWTVGTHLRRIYAKLGVGSRAAMVTRRLENEWRGADRRDGAACSPADNDRANPSYSL